MEKIKKQKKIWIGAAAGVVLFAVLIAAIAALKGGKEPVYRSIRIVELEGGVSIDRDGVGTLAAAKNMNLVSGDRVTTAEKAYVVLCLDTDKYVMLGEAGAMKVVAEGDENRGKTSISLESGSVLNEIQNPLSEGSSYEIATPNATMSVRGTVFEVKKENEGDGQISVLVYDGSVAVGLDGKEPVLYKAGEYTVFTDSADPEVLVERGTVSEEVLGDRVRERLQQMNTEGRTLNVGSADLSAAEKATSAPAPTETPVVTATPAPTATPVITATPAPTATPVITATPAPAATPVVTATPAPTATPVVTATPVPTATPEVTATPAPAATPVVTATPAPAATPEVAATPVPAAAPTAAPVVTATPVPEPEEDDEEEPEPTSVPTAALTAEPTPKPTAAPTAEPTPKPTAAPTAEPTPKPTAAPTAKPTPKPTAAPIAEPTPKPTWTPWPWWPTIEPTVEPTTAPTADPTAAPTAAPTTEPTAAPTIAPTAEPTTAPTAAPTAEPTAAPTIAPTAEPTTAPTAVPTTEPTAAPTAVPTTEPTATPTAAPSATPAPPQEGYCRMSYEIPYVLLSGKEPENADEAKSILPPLVLGPCDVKKGELLNWRQEKAEVTTIPNHVDVQDLGFEFVGWYRINGSDAWNFDTDVIMENMVLYPVWKDKDGNLYKVKVSEELGVCYSIKEMPAATPSPAPSSEPTGES